MQTQLVPCAGCGEWLARRNAAISPAGTWQCRSCHAIDTVLAADPRRACAWCRAYGDRCRVHGCRP